jgi:2-polyprenyl-6-methoxyphenol hydroxylase-like FAD-dependent oxidoreductase
MTRETNADQVVIAGAGLAGLAAAATAARAGARVLILDEKSPGGRARTDEMDRFRFNRGPHAVYVGGAGRRVLNRLGVRPATHLPPLRGARVLAGGGLYPPLSRRVLGARAAAQLTAAFTRISRTGRADSPRISTRGWLASLDLTPRAAAMLEFIVRVTSYVADMDAIPADLAIGQLRMAWRGVGYLDQGWQALVDGLQARATEAGAQLRAHTPVAGISGEPGAWRVRTLAGEEIPAAAVVVATGTPTGTRRLLPADPGWDGLGPEVTAACLDLGVRHIRTRLTFGIDEPLYLSPHAPGGKLAPAGMGMVHVMRYGATSAGVDRARLETFAAAAGIAAGDVATSRFLPKMTVATALPAVGMGLAGRPSVAVEEAPGLFVAGDWAGPTGWLSDASLASGEQAGLLAARAVQPVVRASLTAA